ncbi:MAG: beta-lactamase family protein, partial [Myxococcaceae bacterium]|nr:beta-lactamase family protein [Myxococcaceae bacterium]
MTDLRALLEEGRRARVFSHARAVVRLRGQTVFDDGPALADARFDLASVTKVMATTACLLRLSDAGRLPLDAPLRRWLPEAAVDASVEDLAFHRAGLPAFRPFFAEVASRHPALFELPRQAAPTLRAAVRAQVLERVCAVPAERGRCTAAVYGDLGFILLGEVLERVTGLPLDEAFAQHVARPLGLQAGFRRLSAASPDERVVTTGGTRPREPAPGQEGLWSCPTWPSLPGEVDDDNAWVMDGVAGHAGLFAT